IPRPNGYHPQKTIGGYFRHPTKSSFDKVERLRQRLTSVLLRSTGIYLLIHPFYLPKQNILIPDLRGRYQPPCHRPHERFYVQLPKFACPCWHPRCSRHNRCLSKVRSPRIPPSPPGLDRYLSYRLYRNAQDLSTSAMFRCC